MWLFNLLSRILVLAILGVACGRPSGFAQAPIQLGDVVASARVTTRTVQILGSDPALVRLASRLFELHGGLREVSTAADFVLHFEPSGNSVSISIQSGGQTLWQNSFSGSDRSDALCMAADASVARILGIPGFFRSQMAFVSDRSGHPEIYMADLLFGKVRQLTRDRSEVLSPALSPDGTILLYTSYHANGFPDIFRIDLTTGRRTVFAGFRGTNSGATFSPDGASVAMVLSSQGNSEIFVSNRDGQQLRRLTSTPALEADPSWSPDGGRIALTSDQMGRPQIFSMDRSGANLRRVRTDISRNCSEPSWNPRDANLLAFTAAMGAEFEVAVFNFTTNQSKVVSSGAGDAVHPVWLRDGRHLIHTQRTAHFSRLMILDTLTGQSAVLSPDDLNNARQATWFYPR